MKTERCGKKYDAGNGKIEKCARKKGHKGSYCGPTKTDIHDQDGVPLRPGDEVDFLVPTHGVSRPAIVKGKDLVDRRRVSITIIGDPFPVGVLPGYLKKGTKVVKTQERPSRKELRKLARSLDIDGWEEMTEKQLASAIKKLAKTATPAKAPKKTKAKTNGVKKVPRGQTKADRGEPVTPSEKAKATKTKKKATKATTKVKKAAKTRVSVEREPAANGNPFRDGSNSFLIAEKLIKGGTRSKMIEQLLKKIDFRPHTKKKKSLDPEYEMDKRILMAAHQLQHIHGFTVVHMGRGVGSNIRVFPPDVKVPADVMKKATLVNGCRPGETIPISGINSKGRGANLAPKKAKTTKKAASKKKAPPTKAKEKPATKATKSKKTTKKKAKAKK